MYFLKKFDLYVIGLALISLIITITNLGFTRSFVGDDIGIAYLYPDTLSKRTWSMWEEHMFPGRSNAIGAIAFVYNQIILFGYYIGLNDIIIQRLQYFSFFFFSGYGVYLLFKLLNKTVQQNLVARTAFVSALVYMLNYYVIVMAAFPITNYHISYILLPWVFYLFLQLANENRSFSRLFVFVIVLILLLSGNPANTIVILGLLGIYVIVYYREILIPKYYFVLFPLLFMLCTSYIYLPILANKSNPYYNNSTDLNIDSLSFSSLNSSFLNLFRFQGYHSAETFTFYNDYNSNPLIVIATFVLPILVVYSMLLGFYSSKEKFFLATSLIFMFLAKGVHKPLSEVFYYFFQKYFVLQMYRSAYFKFEYIVIFCFALLIGYLLLKTKKTASYVLSWVICIAIFGSTIPLITGKTARYFHKTIIPQEYNNLRSYLKNNKLEGKVLALPQVPGILLKWGSDNYYVGQYYQDNIFLDRGVWSSTWFSQDLQKYFTDGKQLDQGLALLGYYNIKYIFLHKDIPEDYKLDVGVIGTPKGLSAYKRIAELLASTGYAAKVMDTEYFTLYELSDLAFLPRIYTPDSITASTANSSNVLSTLPKNLPSSRDLIFFADQNQNQSDLIQYIKVKFKFNSNTTLEYKMVSASKYRVLVHNAGGILPIILNESYHEGWRIYQTPYLKDKPTTDDYISKYYNGSIQNNNLNDGTFYENIPFIRNKDIKQIQESNHLISTGYANSWTIDINKLCENSQYCIYNTDGTYDLELLIEFTPQQYFILGLLISSTTISICVVVIIIIKTRKIIKEYLKVRL